MWYCLPGTVFMGMGKLEQVTNFYYNKLTDILNYVHDNVHKN